jgi:hypothetical protein
MKLAISFAEDGTITTMFDPEKLRGTKTILAYIPAAGEKHQLFDLPTQFEGKPFTDLSGLLHVNVTASGGPKLEAK